MKFSLGLEIIQIPLAIIQIKCPLKTFKISNTYSAEEN